METDWQPVIDGIASLIHLIALFGVIGLFAVIWKWLF